MLGRKTNCTFDDYFAPIPNQVPQKRAKSLNAFRLFLVLSRERRATALVLARLTTRTAALSLPELSLLYRKGRKEQMRSF
jgi:hypothetical protein